MINYGFYCRYNRGCIKQCFNCIEIYWDARRKAMIQAANSSALTRRAMMDQLDKTPREFILKVD